MTSNDIRIAHGAQALLAQFNEAGILSPADVHVAATLSELVGETRPEAALLVALTVRAVRHGSVCLDLGHLPTSADDQRTSRWDAPAELWPELDWSSLIATSPLLTSAVAPIVVEDSRIYLDRYWQEETFVLHELLDRLPAQAPQTTADVAAALAEYFPDDAYADQRRAAQISSTSPFAIITGGPGSGKTTTVARLLGILLHTSPGIRIALAAPTGKAAARMVQAIHEAASRPDFPRAHAEHIMNLEATTIHRLLGYSPHRGYRHNEQAHLPYDVVIVDETSMVSLDLMTRLLRATFSATSLIFVGDANQLASVEVGAVFSDLIEGLRNHPVSPIAELGASRRFGAEIDALAQAINAGEADDVVDILASGHTGAVGWMEEEGVVAEFLPTAHEMNVAAKGGKVERALGLLESQQILCAHRHGPYGASTWNRKIEAGLAGLVGTHLGEHFPGQPLLVTKNDHTLRLYNGDIGVVINHEGRLGVAFAGTSGPRIVPLSQLSDVMSAYAMTIHRSQGSQFGRVYVLLPEETSRILTRELLYTGVTRARKSVRIIGEEASLRAAIGRRVERASGLALRLSS